MKKIILAMVAVLATCTLSAQEFRWGPTLGLNLANIHFSEQNSSDCYLGFNLGFKGELTFTDAQSDGFYADARLLYTLKGGSWEGFHENLGYIELPLNAGYRYALSNDVRLFAGVGPYFAIGMGGSHVVKDSHTKIKTDLYGITYKRFDFGLNYNVGVEIYDEWQIFLGFEHGLLNSRKSAVDVENFKMHPLNFYIGAAMMF